MILELFMVFVGIAFVFVILGFLTPVRVYSIIGFSLLFILSSWVMLSQYMPPSLATGGLEYRSGLNVTEVGGVSIVSYAYSVYDDSTTFWIGLLMSIISAISVWLVVVYDK